MDDPRCLVELLLLLVLVAPNLNTTCVNEPLQQTGDGGLATFRRSADEHVQPPAVLLLVLALLVPNVVHGLTLRIPGLPKNGCAPGAKALDSIETHDHEPALLVRVTLDKLFREDTDVTLPRKPSSHVVLGNRLRLRVARLPEINLATKVLGPPA